MLLNIRSVWVEECWPLRAGIPTVDFDFSGHGANPHPFPLASFVIARFGRRRERNPSATFSLWHVLFIGAAPVLVVPLVLRVAQVLPVDVTELLPIQIVNYLAMYLLLTGLLMGVGLWLLQGKNFAPWRDIRHASIIGAALFLAWMVATNGLVAHLTWLNFIPTTGTRIMLLPIVCALLAPYFVVSEYRQSPIRCGAARSTNW